MLNALHQLPNTLIFLIVVVVLTTIYTAAPFVRVKLVRTGRNETSEDAAFEGFKAVTGMIGVVLAFSLVQANGNLQMVDGLVGKEAAAIASVDRALLRSGRPELTALRPVLADFGSQIVRKEWPLLASANRSPEADDAFSKLSGDVRSFNPADSRQQTLFSELLTQIDDLADLREQVIQASEVALPDFFWVTAGGLLALALLLAAFTSAGIKQRVGVAASAAAVALMMAFLIIVDRPFEGQTSVSAASISKALERNAKRPAL